VSCVGLANAQSTKVNDHLFVCASGRMRSAFGSGMTKLGC
jgi:hypothetical protein